VRQGNRVNATHVMLGLDLSIATGTMLVAFPDWLFSGSGVMVGRGACGGWG
jgi:hypothetical protein